MFCSKGFAMGLFAGAVMGGLMGAMYEPMKSKTNKIRKEAGSLIHTVGDMVDGTGSN